MEIAPVKPKRRRPRNLQGSMEECFQHYLPVFESVGSALKRSWPPEIFVPSLDEEILSSMHLVFCKAYHDRDKSPGLFPPVPELLYRRTEWFLLNQWAPRESIYRITILEIYNTIEHWNPDNPEFIATKSNLAGNDESLFPFQYAPDILDWWFLGFSTHQIAAIYNKSSRTVRRLIGSYYDAIEGKRRRSRGADPDLLPPRPPIPRPRRGKCNRKVL